MSTMASQITRLTIVYSTIYSGANQRKYQRSASLAFVRGIHRMTSEFPAQSASNAENVSIRWRHHGKGALSRFLPHGRKSEEKPSVILHRWYDGCRLPGDTKNQGISSDGIDQVLQEHSGNVDLTTWFLRLLFAVHLMMPFNLMFC